MRTLHGWIRLAVVWEGPCASRFFADDAKALVGTLRAAIPAR